jgi:hypothetical protein
MIKHSVLIALFAKAQDVDPVTANVPANATVDASINGTTDATVMSQSPGEKISAFENSMMDVFKQYGLSDEMLQAKGIALKEIEALEEGDIYDKVEALADVVDPISEDLAEMSGEDFVGTMSSEAVEFYAEAAAYMAKEDQFTAFNSSNWGTKIPKRTDPSNSVKCAA